MAGYDVPPPWAFELLRVVLIAGWIGAVLILLAISGIFIGKGINKSGGAGAVWVLAALPPFLTSAALIVRLFDL